ncbi:MAG: 4a-hydroxytetrahydrobiopterin dehydratase [Planctomycetota bacterium]|jgi:4a-hydroxytetrahydrobiopterin dehydratase
MKTPTTNQLTSKRCVPCEGGVEKYSLAEAEGQLQNLDGWEITHQGQRIRKSWRMADFMAGVDFFAKVADLAEREGHHPDLHLVAYRNVWIEIWTHAIRGLSENDFILAAKIDQLPVDLKA